MKFRQLIASLCVVAGLGLGLQQAALAQSSYKQEYKMSLVLGPQYPWGKGGEIWADLVRERTQGRINIKLYPGASLVGGDQTREFTSLRQGVIDLAVGSTINWSPQVKELNIFSLPFLMPDYKAMDALTQGDVGKDLFDILGKRGVVPLAWGENGFREISNSKHPVRTPADLKGLKLRVVGSPLYLDTMAALGANPVQMSWADAQPAMASGAVDGQENPVSVFTAAKLESMAQKHLTAWGYVADPLIFVVSESVWKTWTPEDQTIVRQAAVDAAKQQVDIARKGMTGEDQSQWKELEGKGVQVVHLSDAERQQFVDATREVYAKWKKQIGEALVNKAEAAISAR